MKLGKVVIRESRMRSSLKDCYGKEDESIKMRLIDTIHAVKFMAMLGCWHESMQLKCCIGLGIIGC